MIEEEETDVPIKSKDPPSAMDIDKELGADVMGATADAGDARMEAESNYVDAAAGTENGPASNEPQSSEMEVEPPKVCLDNFLVFCLYVCGYDVLNLDICAEGCHKDKEKQADRHQCE